MSDKEVRNNKTKRRISISKIIESYKNGMTYKQIGAEFEVSENAIRNRIVEYEKKTGEKIRRTRTSSKNQNIPIKELFIKYATGEDIEELANKYNISKGFVKMKVREFAEKKQIFMKAINKFREECKKNKNVVNAFNLGYTIRTIAIRNGLTEEEVHEILEGNKKRHIEDSKVMNEKMIYNYIVRFGYTKEQVEKFAIDNGFGVNKRMVKLISEYKKNIDLEKNKNSRNEEER